MFSFITINYNSLDFVKLLIRSIRSLTKFDYEIIVIDNDINNSEKISDVLFFKQDFNIGHGQALNLGAKKSNFDYCIFLDSDCHFIKHNFDLFIKNKLETYDIIAVPGSLEKPIRASFLCMAKKMALKYDFSSTSNYQGVRKTPDGYDVGILAYYKMLKEKKKFYWMEINKNNRYQTLNGEEWILDNIPIVYHHWHGSHLVEMQKDFEIDLIKDKEKLFNSEFDF